VLLYLQKCWSHGTSSQRLGGSLQMKADLTGSTASLAERHKQKYFITRTHKDNRIRFRRVLNTENAFSFKHGWLKACCCHARNNLITHNRVCCCWVLNLFRLTDLSSQISLFFQFNSVWCSSIQRPLFLIVKCSYSSCFTAVRWQKCHQCANLFSVNAPHK